MKTNVFTRSIITMLLLVAVAAGSRAQGFSINTTGSSADASAMLDVTSASKGVLIPRMTTAQRTAITSPATGLIVYDNTLAQFYYYNGTAWTGIATGTAATNYWTLSGSNLYNNSGTNVGIGVTSPANKLHVNGNANIGSNNTVTAANGIAIGSNNTSSGNTAAVIGTSSTAAGPFSVVLNQQNTNTPGANNSLVGGFQSYVSGNIGVALGYQDTTTALAAAAFGFNNNAEASYAFAAGNSNKASGEGSAAFGNSNTASGNYSAVFGNNNIVSGTYSAAFGRNNTLGGSDAFAAGMLNSSSGTRSVAFNQGNTASGNNSFAAGFSNTANANLAVAFGNGNTSSGEISASFGEGNTAASYNEFVAGTYSTTYTPVSTSTFNSADRLFNIGNGTGSAARSNAFTILKNGNTGIGTASPSEKLDVNGKTKTTSFQMTSGATNGYVLQSDGSGNASWVNANTITVTETDPQVSSSAANHVPKWNGTTLTDGIIYDNGSNVGIGATSPSSKLVVSNTTASGGHFKLHNPNNAAFDNWWMGFTHGDGLGSGDGNDRARVGAEIAASGSGRLFFTTGGPGTQTERMRINEDGNVGIGTAAPAGKLQVNVTAGNYQVTDFGVFAGTTVLGAYNGTSAGAQLRFTGAVSGFADIGQDASGNFVIEQSDAARLTVAAGGNVGIGTSSPSEKLDVNGKTKTASLQITTGAANGYVLQSDASGNAVWVSPSASLVVAGTGLSYSGTTLNSVWTASGSNIYSNNTGNAGIGTSSPSSKLVVADAVTSAGMLKIFNTNAAALDKWWIGFAHDGSLGNADNNDRARLGIEVAASGSGRLFFTTGNIGTQTERMRIDEFGNTGIGTSAPAEKLDVNGKTKTTSFQMTTGATNGYVLQSDASGNGTWVNANTLPVSYTETDPQVSSSATNYLPKWNGTALTDGIVYDNGTNIGIGAASPSAKLHVSGTGGTSILSEGTSGGAYVEIRSAANNEGATRYNTGSTTRWLMGKSNGAESGGNTGGDFFINRYDDAGSFLGQPFTITRSTGTVNIASLSATAAALTTGNIATLNITGAATIATASKTASYTLTASDYCIVFTGSTAAQTLTLPAAPATGRVIVIVNHATVAVSISPSYTTASGVTNTSIAAGSTVQLLYDGGVWRKIN